MREVSYKSKITDGVDSLSPDNGLNVSLVSGLATGLGGFLFAAAGRAGLRVMPALLGLSSGIGFTVVFFDLLPEAVTAGSWAAAGVGLVLGALFSRVAGFIFPHLRITGSSVIPSPAMGGGGFLKTGCLFALGVAMHNLPEGMAVGAGLEAGRQLGLLLATAIGLHNVPEGMALCGLMLLGGVRLAPALGICAGAGLMMPMGALLARFWMSGAPGLYSFILALGAGALLYIIVAEVIPQSSRMHPSLARTGMAAGAALSLAMSLGFSLD